MITTTFHPQTTTCERGSGRITYTHIVTLRHPRTEQEACIVVTTETERFAEVLMAVRIQRALHDLAGFEIVEALPCEPPF